MGIQSKLTYQTYNIIFLRASCGLRFTSLLILCGGDIDEMIDFKRKKLAWHGSIFYLNENWWGRCRRNLPFSNRNIRSHGTIFLASPLGGDVEKIGDFQEGKIR